MGLQTARQQGYGRMVEQVLDAGLKPQFLPDRRYNTGGQQGIAAKGEEVVVDAHSVHTQKVPPDPTAVLPVCIPQR